MKKGFFARKEGALTIAFIVIMISFAVMIVGVNTNDATLCAIGFTCVMLSMMYSPFRTFFLDKIRK